MSGRHADKLRETLEEEIVTGSFIPGTRLDEVALAHRFQVSRTPIREALNQLASSDLVELRPRRGAFVKPISVAKLIEMFEMMAEMEAVCARLAARRTTDAERQALMEAHAACGRAAETGDPDAYYAENACFHEILYNGCHNRFLADEVRRLRRRLQAYRRLQLRVRNRIGNSFAEHGRIVDAVESGDGKQAEEAARAHIMIQGERFNDLMAELNASQETVA